MRKVEPTVAENDSVDLSSVIISGSSTRSIASTFALLAALTWPAANSSAQTLPPTSRGRSGIVRNDGAAPDWIADLKSYNAEERQKAIFAARDQGADPKIYLDAAKELFLSGPDYQGLFVAMEFGKLAEKDPSLLPLLTEGIRSNTGMTRIGCLLGLVLSKQNTPEASSAIHYALIHPDLMLRRNAFMQFPSVVVDRTNLRDALLPSLLDPNVPNREMARSLASSFIAGAPEPAAITEAQWTELLEILSSTEKELKNPDNDAALEKSASLLARARILAMHGASAEAKDRNGVALDVTYRFLGTTADSFVRICSEQLNSADSAIQQKALGRLALIGLDALPALKRVDQLSRSPRPEVAQAARESAAKICAPFSTQQLLSLEPPRWPEISNYRALFTVVEGKGPQARQAAAQLLEIIEVGSTNTSHHEIAEKLVKNLPDDPSTRQSVIYMLTKNRVPLHQGQAATAAAELKSKDPVLISAVCAVARNPWQTVYNPQASAAESLGKIGVMNPEVRDALRIALNSPSNFVRNQAANAIGEFGPAAKELIPDLDSHLDDPDEYVRSSSAFSLGDLGSASLKSVPKIIEQSKKGKLDVGVAAKVLGQIGDKSALPYVNTLKPVKFYDQDLIDTAKQQLQGGR